RSSEKDRAENVMILDMIRNDLGRLPGGPVQTTDTFSIEKYQTLWQMTSTAETITEASICEIFRALFPCASITGAPKVQTMKLIRDLERQPRRIYTGAIGLISPGRQARFSVAIRTALIDRERQSVEYGVGAGITWNSDPAAEYRECLLKARILSQPQPEFRLLETLLWEPEEGYALQGEHLGRLAASANYFDIPLRQEKIGTQLDKVAAALSPKPHKVRLLVAQNGEIETEAAPLELPETATPLRVALAHEPVDSADPFLYHKTTRREVYESALRNHPDVDEVLLWNERGELTEACNCNLVVEKNGELFTPPVHSGLLSGTLRACLLQEGKIREQKLRKDELEACDKLWLINSVRGWREAYIGEDT
ncbi:MAG: aminodeoxychorismate synthase, component I, partial [Desulfuromonas sp.]